MWYIFIEADKYLISKGCSVFFLSFKALERFFYFVDTYKKPCIARYLFYCLFLCDIFSKFNILGGSALLK